MSTKVTAVIRPIETREIVAVGEDFADARDAAKAQVPDGWTIISYRNDGPAD